MAGTKHFLIRERKSSVRGVKVIKDFRPAVFIQQGRTKRKRNWLRLDRGPRGELEALLSARRTGSVPPVDLEEYLFTTLSTFANEDSLKKLESIEVALGENS